MVSGIMLKKYGLFLSLASFVMLAYAAEPLGDAEVAAALEAIGKSFVNASDVDEAAQRRATLEGLVVRLAPNVRLAGAAETAKSGRAFFEENLDDRLLYMRLGSFDTATLVQLDQAIERANNTEGSAAILDLREAGDNQTAAAVEFAQRFVPEGKPLFTETRRDKETFQNIPQNIPQNSGVSVKFNGRLVVLVNKRTHGTAEAIAGALHSHGAMLIGERTPGHAVEFERKPLNADTALEIATANIILPDGRAIFPDGLTPDLAVVQDIKHIFEESQRSGSVKAFVFEPPQPRFNEAELVARTNSEIDEKREQADRTYDIALQRAVDFITALRFFKK